MCNFKCHLYTSDKLMKFFCIDFCCFTIMTVEQGIQIRSVCLASSCSAAQLAPSGLIHFDDILEYRMPSRVMWVATWSHFGALWENLWPFRGKIGDNWQFSSILRRYLYRGRWTTLLEYLHDRHVEWPYRRNHLFQAKQSKRSYLSRSPSFQGAAL